MNKFSVRRTALASAALAAVGAMAVAAPASALTWVSHLEYRDVDGAVELSDTPYGTVTLEEVDAFNVKVTVTLTSPGSLFINTGGPHDPFLFNTTSDNDVTILPPVDTFYDGGHGAFTASGFGHPSVYFTDRIGCCGDKNGADAGDAPPLVFNVHNASGITFAGIGATFDGEGKLTGLGSGEHFNSTSEGWWFVADIYDAASGKTYNVAARDAFTDTGVPEPATWALMIMGFGGAGAMLRSRRRKAAAAAA